MESVISFIFVCLFILFVYGFSLYFYRKKKPCDIHYVPEYDDKIELKRETKKKKYEIKSKLFDPYETEYVYGFGDMFEWNNNF